jgi:DNA-binding transcriptional MocR family regulator
MFTTDRLYDSYFRFNASWAWGDREEQAVKTLGALIQQL